MRPIRTVGCLLVAAALAAGCSSSSTGPKAAPFVGEWQITWTNVVSPATIHQAEDTLTIVQTAGGYTVSYSDFNHSDGMNYNEPYSKLSSLSSFAVSGDSVIWHVGDMITPACWLVVDGTATSTSMQGTAVQSGPAGCPNESWGWTAIKL